MTGLSVSKGKYREESTQAIHFLWILWSSIFVQLHHELLTVKQASSQLKPRPICRMGIACGWIWGRCFCVPDLFSLASVVQREEHVGILADAVVSKALQIDEEVVRHGDTATVTMALSRAVTLGTKEKVTANKTGPYCEAGQVPGTLNIYIYIFIYRHTLFIRSIRLL